MMEVTNREIKREKNFGLRRRPTWIKCMFDPPPIRCPHDKGMEVHIYSSLSRVDTIVTSHEVTNINCKIVFHETRFGHWRLAFKVNDAIPWVAWSQGHVFGDVHFVLTNLCDCGDSSTWMFIYKSFDAKNPWSQLRSLFTDLTYTEYTMHSPNPTGWSHQSFVRVNNLVYFIFIEYYI